MAQKVAYVTGGMGGIGTAICQRLHKEGFKVIAGCGPSRDFQKWLDEQKALGYNFHASVGNVGDWASTVEAFSNMAPWPIPTINTALLLTSGVTLTIAHHALIAGNRAKTIAWMWITVALGLTDASPLEALDPDNPQAAGAQCCQQGQAARQERRSHTAGQCQQAAGQAQRRDGAVAALQQLRQRRQQADRQEATDRQGQQHQMLTQGAVLETGGKQTGEVEYAF